MKYTTYYDPQSKIMTRVAQGKVHLEDSMIFWEDFFSGYNSNVIKGVILDDREMIPCLSKDDLHRSVDYVQQHIDKYKLLPIAKVYDGEAIAYALNLECPLLC